VYPGLFQARGAGHRYRATRWGARPGLAAAWLGRGVSARRARQLGPGAPTL
nr:hypothetical protein [Tanacetum cinerariifolium]